jgi:lipopolysaccharide export system protein LptA
MMKAAALLTVTIIALSGGAAHAAVPATTANPLGLNSREPIAVNADSFLADLNGNTGTYTGNVIVTQGTVKLHADEVKVVAPGGRASRMEAQGHVIVDSPSGRAIADTGVYDVPQQMLRLTGNVVLTKEQNVMRGTALEFSMATGLARMTAGTPAVTASTAGPLNQAPVKPARVQGLFYPEQASPAPAATESRP